MRHERELPPMPLWQARSFWLGVFTLAAIGANAFGWSLDEHAWTQTVMQLVPLVTAALAYRERMNPRRRLSVKREPLT